MTMQDRRYLGPLLVLITKLLVTMILLSNK